LNFEKMASAVSFDVIVAATSSKFGIGCVLTCSLTSEIDRLGHARQILYGLIARCSLVALWK
jgi:hypothetical protein